MGFNTKYILFLDPVLEKIPALDRIRRSPVTVWAMSSVFIFIDMILYTLTFASQTDILQGKMNMSESTNGLTTTVYGVGGLVAALLSGIVSDSIGSRRILQALSGLIYIVSGIIFYYTTQYYQLLIFRTIIGIGSGCSCVMLYSAVGDVYSDHLLGSKIAAIGFANNLGYTLGPYIGNRIYEAFELHGVSLVIIGLGVFQIAATLVLIEESLVIKHGLSEAKPKDRPSSAPRHASSDEEKGPKDGAESSSSQRSMPIWRLILHVPMVISTLSIIASAGLQCTLESVIPLYLRARYNQTAGETSLVFVIYGVSIMVFVLFVGSISDFIIRRRGEQGRYYIMALGAVLGIPAMAAISFSKSFAVMMFGYVFYSFAELLMLIPAQSSCGDFVNSMNMNSMAKSYGLSMASWYLSAITLPPIGTALYTHVGFSNTLVSMASLVCTVCAILCIGYAVLFKSC